MKNLITFFLSAWFVCSLFICFSQQKEGDTYYLRSKKFIKETPRYKKDKIRSCFGYWGIRQITEKGFEYNTSFSFEHAYVLYYFDTLNPNTNLGTYYQSDAFYLKDLIPLAEKNNFSNPALNIDGWGIPFYCSIYYYSTSSVGADTISLCAPKMWKKGDKIEERKIFQLNDSCTLLTKLFEYKKYNPDPILMGSYNLEIYKQKGFEDWFNKRKKEILAEESLRRYSSPFNIYLDSTMFSNQSTGWVYFATKENINKLESYTFYFKGGLYNSYFKARKRFALDTNLNLKYPILHPSRWFHKNHKIVPIYDIAVYDSISKKNGKGTIINVASNDFFYDLLEKKTIKDYENNKEYIWVKINLEHQIKKQLNKRQEYLEQIEKRKKKKDKK